MMQSPKVLWAVIAVLVVVLLGFTVKFVVLGSTTSGTAEDERTVIMLNGHERAATLLEMRSLLEATQAVIEGLANDDMAQVAQAASDVGMQARGTMDMRLMAKLPIGFKKLGMGTHKAFDDIAAMAIAGVPAMDIQRKLADTMNNCIACHASYQMPSMKPQL
ncbi:MAG: hypothetical protein Q9M19_03035 [Mariprofundaceae bacterium]|nr:hypothetical protein [Mariprofundaceae bacterium]